MATIKTAEGESVLGGSPSAAGHFEQTLAALSNSISRVVVLSEETTRYVLLGLVSEGHILLEDTPGLGKTLLAKTLIQGIFSRIQCTPDLLPNDITGSSIFNMQDNRSEFRPGPVFSNVLVADEINRTSPRTQSALLEAMAEYHVSVDNEVHPLPKPFMVIATQNAMESHGVFPLPDSQLDRFLISMRLGLPTASQEIEILSRAEHGLPQPTPVVSTSDIVAMQDVVKKVNVALPLKEYLVNLAQASRSHPMVSRGFSPRGTVSLQRAAQGWAAFEGRDYLIPEDVQRVAHLVLPHRMVARAVSDVTRSEIVQEILESVPVPL